MSTYWGSPIQEAVLPTENITFNWPMKSLSAPKHGVLVNIFCSHFTSFNSEFSNIHKTKLDWVTLWQYCYRYTHRPGLRSKYYFIQRLANGLGITWLYLFLYSSTLQIQCYHLFTFVSYRSYFVYLVLFLRFVKFGCS